MIINSPKENKVRIKLNKGFYSAACVKEALKKFRKVARGNLSISGSLQVTLYPRNKEVGGIIGYEFSNYVLSLMKNKGVV